MAKSKVKVKKSFTTSLMAADPAAFQNNYSIVRLVKFGFSTQAIADHNGLSLSQVQNRVRMYGLQGVRREFRHGLTAEAGIVREAALQVPQHIQDKEAAKYNKIRTTVLKSIRAAHA